MYFFIIMYFKEAHLSLLTIKVIQEKFWSFRNQSEAPG